ncbi:MAG TPA: hypothetical protein DCX07_12325, partial [Phycisphaerales bacterium]|nr:hypothetical protein [Phycisphaerales bacterium]
MKRGGIFAAMLVMTLFASCYHEEYTIEVTPRGPRMERSLVVVAVDGPASMPDEEVSRLAGLYGRPAATEPTSRFAARGTFADRTPADVGGAGFYRQYATPMGCAYLYSERFRGDDDLQGQLARRLAATDQAVDLLIGWLESELKGKDGWDRLRAFLDGQFRADMRNLATYMWSLRTAERLIALREATSSAPASAPAGQSEQSPDADIGWRMAHYLAERGYLDAETLPVFATLTRGDSPGVTKAALGALQRLAARKMGVGDAEPIPAALAWLGDIDRVRASLDKYVPTTKLYAGEQAEHRKDNPQADAPAGSEVFLLAWSKGIAGAGPFGDTPDIVKLSLAATTCPGTTGGTWDAEGGRVRWELYIPQRGKTGEGLPALAYAAWAEPDEAFQKAHFGRVVLGGGELHRQCLWYHALPAAQRKEWDAFVAALTPGDGLAAKLAAFRFSTDAPETRA